MLNLQARFSYRRCAGAVAPPHEGRKALSFCVNRFRLLPSGLIKNKEAVSSVAER
jgi:hypothetical protein